MGVWRAEAKGSAVLAGGKIAVRIIVLRARMIWYLQLFGSREVGRSGQMLRRWRPSKSRRDQSVLQRKKVMPEARFGALSKADTWTAGTALFRRHHPVSPHLSQSGHPLSGKLMLTASLFQRRRRFPLPRIRRSLSAARGHLLICSPAERREHLRTRATVGAVRRRRILDARLLRLVSPFTSHRTQVFRNISRQTFVYSSSNCCTPRAPSPSPFSLIDSPLLLFGNVFSRDQNLLYSSITNETNG